MSINNHDLCSSLGKLLLAKKLLICTAESCTGGLVASSITAIAGSSQWFERGFVTYSNQAKQEMLGVNPETLNQYGAVSENVAKEMAAGAIRNSQADISLAITGIAGPSGGTPEKPVGTVCFAWSGLEKQTIAETIIFDGNRNSIQEQAAIYALKYLVEHLSKSL